MTVRFLGTGGAFDVQQGNSAVYLKREGGDLLIDCGHSVYPRLRQLNLADSLAGILITHTHDDHVGSLGSLLAHQRYLGGRTAPLPVYYPSPSFRDQLGGYLSYVLGNVGKYVDWRSVDELPDIWSINTSGGHVEGLPSYAYAGRHGMQRWVFSGDLAKPERLFTWLDQQGWHGATVFHDVTFAKENTNHTFYKALEAYQPQYRLFGYHCNPKDKPEDCTIDLVADQPGLLF